MLIPNPIASSVSASSSSFQKSPLPGLARRPGPAPLPVVLPGVASARRPRVQHLRAGECPTGGAPHQLRALRRPAPRALLAQRGRRNAAAATDLRGAGLRARLHNMAGVPGAERATKAGTATPSRPPFPPHFWSSAGPRAAPRVVARDGGAISAQPDRAQFLLHDWPGQL